MRSLVLGCTGILTADKPRAPKWANHFFRLPKRVLVDRTRYGPACPPANAATNQAVLRKDITQRRALVAQQNALRAYATTREDIATLTMPSLVLHGTDDPIVPLDWGRELAATLPSSQLVIYQGAGHNYLVDIGDAPNSDVLAFLEKVDATVKA